MNPILKRIVDLLHSMSDNEATAYPFWFVAHKGWGGHPVMLRGVWFSREAALGSK